MIADMAIPASLKFRTSLLQRNKDIGSIYCQRVGRAGWRKSWASGGGSDIAIILTLSRTPAAGIARLKTITGDLALPTAHTCGTYALTCRLISIRPIRGIMIRRFRARLFMVRSHVCTLEGSTTQPAAIWSFASICENIVQRVYSTRLT